MASSFACLFLSFCKIDILHENSSLKLLSLFVFNSFREKKRCAKNATNFKQHFQLMKGYDVEVNYNYDTLLHKNADYRYFSQYLISFSSVSKVMANSGYLENCTSSKMYTALTNFINRSYLHGYTI